MPLNSHEIAQQRHLKRHLTFWRFMAVAVLIIGLIAVSAVTINNKTFSIRQQHIATIEISGIIYRDDRLLAQLKKIEKSDKVSGLILIIDSPGGTVTGSEDIYLAIRKIAAKKPVAALMRGVAASGGYISAIAADHIFASSNTITGSIGVIYQWPEYVELLNKVGVKMQTVKSSPLKAEPSGMVPLTNEVRQQVETSVKDSYDWFVGLVSERRDMSMNNALRLADGRVYSGRQALAENLIDAIGDIDTAQQWLKNQLQQDGKSYEDLESIDWTPPLFEQAGLNQFLKIQINNIVGVKVFDINNTKNISSTGLMALMLN
ncbi:MAG: signal peptide peptidase SppA [Hyphomicrobiales bacterium]|nr:MAG: signal peptide peptidase SppA [Hyphomicrobiales bacterium]